MTGDEPARIGDRIDRLRQLQPSVPVPAAPRPAPDAEISAWLADQAWSRTVPEQFQSARLDDVDDQVREAVAAWARSAVEHTARNLVVTGPVGVGKTHVALAAARVVVEAGARVEFWPVDQLLDQLRPDGDPAVGRAAYACAVLVLDDLGAERRTEWTAERIHQVVNDRWLHRRPIIATTNLAIPDLESHLGERTYSRLVDHATAVRLTGPDRRRTR